MSFPKGNVCNLHSSHLHSYRASSFCHVRNSRKPQRKEQKSSLACSNVWRTIGKKRTHVLTSYTSETYLSFLMFYAYITPIATCLYILHSIFMHFLRTNLLTRCHSASSCFLLFLYSRKTILKIFSELDEIGQDPLFFEHIYGVQRLDGEEPRAGHTMGRYRPPSCHSMGWCGPHSSRIPFAYLFFPMHKP